MVLNSLSYCLSVKLLISLSNLNEILAGYSILGFRLFPFITLNISYHSLLACRIAPDKSAVKCMELPCMLFVIFPLFILTFFFVFNFFQFDYYVSRLVSPWVYPAWDSLCFLDLGGYFLSHVREVFYYNLIR